MIKQQYDKTVDVYAFGMLLWRVCEGKGNQPKNVHKHFLPLVMLMLNAVENKTPERLETFPQNCWELMERCWASDPEKRPSMDAVVKDLEEILRDPNWWSNNRFSLCGVLIHFWIFSKQTTGHK